VTAPSDIPAVFRDVLAGLEELRYVTEPGDAFYECFGCGPGHPDGLRVRCFKDREGVVAPVVIPARYQGPKGSAQGGIVATYLDEVLGAAVVRATGHAAVTGELTIRYVAGAPLETPLLGRGRLVKDHGRYVDVEGHLTVLETGRTIATARGRFFPIAEPAGDEPRPTAARSMSE
jgi:acyl-coenzyme A thioesterase PaaI-like protein